jgi:hypothetical protein
LTKKGKKVAAAVYRKMAMLETRAFAEISRTVVSLKLAVSSCVLSPCEKGEKFPAQAESHRL